MMDKKDCKILGIDYGDKRIGLAKNLMSMAVPIGTYQSCGMKNDIDYFVRLTAEEGFSLIVIGLPLNMDGTEGDRVTKTKKFAAILQKATGIGVEFVDERLTTVEAHRVLDEMKIDPKKHEKNVDAISAQIILQTFLNKINNSATAGKGE